MPLELPTPTSTQHKLKNNTYIEIHISFFHALVYGGQKEGFQGQSWVSLSMKHIITSRNQPCIFGVHYHVLNEHY